MDGVGLGVGTGIERMNGWNGWMAGTDDKSQTKLLSTEFEPYFFQVEPLTLIVSYYDIM